MPNRVITRSHFNEGLFYSYLIAIAILAFFVTRTVLNNSRVAADSHRALCALKIERQHRVEQTAHILNSHDPADLAIVKAFGRPLLLRSLATAKADRDALKDVSC